MCKGFGNGTDMFGDHVLHAFDVLSIWVRGSNAI